MLRNPSPLLVLFFVPCSATADDKSAAVMVERNVAVPMRDGVILRADVYRPKAGGPYPVLVLRTPYNKGGVKGEVYARAGYMVVCQDVRGRYASEGTFESFVREKTHDAEDGFDTVEWAARLPGSNGKVGTFGASYNAFLQWRLAPLRPPSLLAMSAQTIPARYTDLEGPGTIRPGRRLLWWNCTMAPDMRRRAGRDGPQTPPAARRLWEAGEGESLLRFLPWLDLPDRVFEGEAGPVRRWLKNPALDPWRLDQACRDVAVPNLDIVGWFDHCNGDMRLFRTMVKEGKTQAARAGQRLIVGPWSHSGRGQRRFGAIDFGPPAALNLRDLEIRWFDHWLKGIDNGVEREAPVKIFVMGVNRWREEKEWPLSRARPRTFFLTSAGRANTPSGNGRLLPHPATSPGMDQFTYDPRDPVPSLFGSALYAVPTERSILDSRQDILIYQTDPLKEPLEITGNPVVELFASSSAPDTDFFARLVDVAPDGKARDISLGMVRARYRQSLAKPVFLKPGEVESLSVRLNPTSNQFQAGHRLRLEITSSDFPNYDRNHNTDKDQNADATLAPAEQRVYHGERYPSRLILPVVG
jgi:putative CocE/NonD family hydrolase